MAACRKIENAEDFENLIKSVDTFLFDCDGVLWHPGNIAIAGAVDTIKQLKSMGKHVLYVTNNSTKTREEYVEKCKDLGFPATSEEIVCTSYVTAQYLKNILKLTDKVYLVGSPGLIQEFDKAGIKYTGPDDKVQGTLGDWMETDFDPEVKCVVVGFDQFISYYKMMKAATYLMNKDCVFIATNTDSTLPAERKDIKLPGTGAVLASIVTASGRQPDVTMGKPHRAIFDVIVEQHKLTPGRTVMVGDRLNTDISLANNFGMQSILVLTGVSTLSDVENCKKSNSIEDQKCIPKFYIESVSKMAKYMQ